MKIPKINLWAFGETFITHIFYYCGCGKYVPNGITAPTCWWSEDLMPRMAFCSYRKRPSSRDHGSFRRLAQGPITITRYTFTIKSTASTAALFALNRSVFSERFVKLLITHIFGQAVADVDIGQAGHAAPEDNVAWWRISRSVLIAAERSQSEQEVADGFSLANIEWSNTIRLFCQHHVD